MPEKKKLALICVKNGNTPDIQKQFDDNPIIQAYKSSGEDDLCVIVQPNQDKELVKKAVAQIIAEYRKKSKELKIEEVTEE